MALSKYERDIILMKAKAVVVPQDAPVATLEDAFDIIYELFIKNKATAYLDSKQNVISAVIVSGNPVPVDSIHIADMNYDKSTGVCSILVNRGDENLTDPAFIDTVTRKSRVAAKGTNEVVGYSAHIVIDFKNPDAIGCHKLIFERVPNLGRSLVFEFFNHLLKAHAENNTKFQFTNPKTKQVKDYRIKFDTEFAKSPQLEKDLKEGRMTGVELIKRNSSDEGLDNLPNIKKVTKKLIIAVDHGSVANPLNWLNKMKKHAANDGFDEIQVKIQGASGGSKSPRFATALQDAAEVLYARLESIKDFAKPLDQCREKINYDVSNKMTVALKNTSLWK